jgi:acetyltransferase-like isoleucine patch superfamily enzyme
VRRRFAAATDDLRPVRHTAQRVPPDQHPPAPHAFHEFGDGSWVVPPAAVPNPGRVAIGAGVIVLEWSTLRAVGEATGAPLITLGAGTRLARMNELTATVGITIGESVSSSDYASVFDTWNVDGRPMAGEPGRHAAPVVIGRGAYLGCSSTVCPGVTIGEGAYVGEGAVVVDDVPAFSVVYGDPAVVVRQFDRDTGEWVEAAP